MRFGSVCSGIEAASVAWGPLGWQGAWFSEIEPFPSNLLAHHYPNVPNLGDMTTLPERILRGEVKAPEVLCGGTPCQAFSVAGLRKSLDDARGNLSLVFCEIANAIDDARFIDGDEPAVVFWENVPGVLNTKDNAFGCFLAGLAGEAEPLDAPGGRWANAGYVLGPQRAIAWRILDAQYFGVAQRRRRVFVVASARAGFDPAAILFEFEGVRRDTAPSREPGERVTNALADRADRGGTNSEGQRLIPVGCGPVLSASTGDISHCLNAGGMGRLDYETESLISFHSNAQVDQMCFDPHLSSPLTCSQNAAVQTDMQVRRLTPRECERLQGFPDDYTLVPHGRRVREEKLDLDFVKYLLRGNPKYLTRSDISRLAADGPRYKALGNSWAVPNVRWIGQRIDLHLLGLL